MTKRKDPSELKIRARDDLTPKPRTKRGANKSPEARAARLEKIKTMPHHSNNGTVALIEQQDPDRPVTEKQMLFVKAWASGETILSASYRAGYADAGSMAYRLARDPAILKIYNREKALYEESCQMTRKRVMEGLLEGVEMAKLVSEPASVISGWREIGKMCGYYEPIKRTVDINIRGDVTMKHLDRLSDADLLKMIKGEVTDVAFNEVAAEEEGEG